MVREKRPSYVGIVGENELKDGTITIRGRNNKQKAYQIDEFIDEIKKEIKERRIAQMI